MQTALFEGLTSLHPVTSEPIAALATHYEMARAAPSSLSSCGGIPRHVVFVCRIPANCPKSTAAAARRLQTGSPRFGAMAARLPRKTSRTRGTESRIPPRPRIWLLCISRGFAVFEALDEFTFQVDLSEPNPIFPKFLWLPAFAAVPRHAVEAAKRAGREASWTEPRRMVSSGPFVLDEWLPMNKIVLRRNPRYYEASLVSLDELVFLPTVNGATMVNLYKSGESHVTDVRIIPPIYAPAVAGTRGRTPLRFEPLRLVFDEHDAAALG